MLKKITKPVYIVDGIRTAIANPYKSLKELTAPQLACATIKEVIKRNGIKKKAISEVVFGNVVGAGTGQNLARQAALDAGLAIDLPSYTVNNVCGAGMQAVILGARSIQSGESGFCIAGGAESATHTPELKKKYESESSVDSLYVDGLYDQNTKKNMGELVEDLSKRHRIRRKEQDIFSYKSHVKAYTAQSKGALISEIVPIKTSAAHLVDRDDRVRKNIKIDSFESLTPAFKQKGSVTAGNSSVACDGAACLLLASKEAIEKNRVKPRAKIVGYASVSTRPERTFESAVEAIESLVEGCNLTLDKIDLYEIAEAFASQIIFIKNKLKIPYEKLNIFGGDIALGHPLGAAGTRVIVTLLNALESSGKKRGIACVSFGGGGSIAMLIEKI